MKFFLYIPTSKTTNTPPILTSPRALAVATLPLPDRRVLQSSESDLKKCKQRVDNIYVRNYVNNIIILTIFHGISTIYRSTFESHLSLVKTKWLC